MKITKEEALNRIKQAIMHKNDWKREIEEEYAQKGETVTVTFL